MLTTDMVNNGYYEYGDTGFCRDNTDGSKSIIIENEHPTDPNSEEDLGYSLLRETPPPHDGNEMNAEDSFDTLAEACQAGLQWDI